MSTLFVDFHGTICHDRFWRSLGSDSFGRVQRALFEADPSLVNDWMRGKYSSEEINELVAEITGLPFDRLWQTFMRDCKSMRISSDLLAEITVLRKVCRVVLITDNMDCFDRFTLPALCLDTVFDGIANSSSEGCLKTDGDGETFIRYLTGDITDAVLVDDSRTSCEVFEKLGGIAYHVNDTTPAIEHLKNLVASA
ncbi:MAG: hypothetical protein AAF367_01495 [Pseudomonadota bacterium]